MDTGLLILRLLAGLLVAGHGVQKISHRLGGHGLEGGAREFRGDGFRGGNLTALAAGTGQIGSGLLLALGLLTPLAATGAIGVMTVALTVKWHNGLWVQNDGYEYPLVLIATAAALAATGPGAWSLDRVLGLTPYPLWWLGVALVSGIGSGLLTRVVLHTAAPRPTGDA
ncbi:DoxX family membrane protein [Streptomyces sp. NPDC060334]|uniref:DoxX family membrane protein n=1 Tax=unclassified Streptomyces TaxID=2593676 RepID=UPI002255763A|nr:MULTISPECIES: DoxX family membrane protein [unclassified Streptomyces]MCX5071709.1 DoxX family membrane protein [Streptomyces sp. NBC_00424]MCX5157437.1 DoxX family membrane protein [Streptomyces sp. NBC_00291]WUD44906.1 DoxX family membrane protein [Streptomyces sp. NBC_00513]